MKRCILCGKENDDSNQYCYNCGEEFDDSTFETENNVEQEILNDPISDKQNTNQGVRCPNCNSKKIAYLTKESDGFSGSNACCGYIIFGPLGLLCGLSGKRESLTLRKCMDCGHEF
ncbi:MAG: hypothetical protein ACQERX_00425 [Bacillota bacterium]